MTILSRPEAKLVKFALRYSVESCGLWPTLVALTICDMWVLLLGHYAIIAGPANNCK